MPLLKEFLIYEVYEHRKKQLHYPVSCAVYDSRTKLVLLASLIFQSELIVHIFKFILLRGKVSSLL